ncbi:DUF748 domain-containing protein, partial [Pseudomonadota bacterium]
MSHATINTHEKIDVNAKIKPFKEKLNAQAKANISAVELPPLSPYIDKHLGYYLKRGQLGAAIDVVIEEDQLNANVIA